MAETSRPGRMPGWLHAPRVSTRGRGRWTRFGTVAVLGATRVRHEAWWETVVVEVEVHNGSDRAILVSPDQFRLRAGSGQRFSPDDSGWSAGPLSASETMVSWVSYLTPRGAPDLWVEYDEPGATGAQAFVIPEPRRDLETDASIAI